MSGLYGNVCGGFGNPKTYVLTDENGKEITGVLVDNLTVFTATPEDVRSGKVFAGDEGVKTGTNTSMTGGGIEDVEWHQCPQLVRNFINQVTYSSNDYDTSEIVNYAPATAVASNYKPIGQTVGNVTYYNQVPNILTAYAENNYAGTLKPLDRLRWINTTTWNVRDLGGWSCDGGTVKYGLLFRGGEPSKNDYKVLVEELGVRWDLNLRGKTEATWTSSPLGEDVHFVCADEYNWYEAKVNDAWKTNIRCIFDAVTHNEPVYFHCAAGADRTGTLACVLEGLLGMSQSDIDKDYELTSFYSGTNTDNAARRRNEDDWKGLIIDINSYSGSTFRDRCINFVAQLGFTAEEINAYRKAMINGSPETVTPSVSTFTVTNTLSGVTSSNSDSSVTQYQSYSAIIKPNNNHIIKDVKIVMNGTDITVTSWDGKITNLYEIVKLNLIGCSSDNQNVKVIKGQSYAANITALDNYTLKGATISITMGGTDVSTYYSEGRITIPEVTGNIVITIEAVEQQTTNLFDYNSAVLYTPNGSNAFILNTTPDNFGSKQDGVIITSKDRYNNTVVWSCDTLKNLSAGTYVFRGKFKQDTAGASAIAVFSDNANNRLFKNSLSVGNTYKDFEYNFTLSSTATVYICAQNDAAASGNAYLSNAEIVLKA